MSNDKDTKVVLAQNVVAKPSASVSRAEQIAAAHEKVKYEAPTLLKDNRSRCMTGEEALSVIDFVSVDKFRQTFRLNPVDICIARQDRSLENDVSLGRYTTLDGIYAPYSDIMRRRGNGSIDAAKLAIKNYQAVVEMLRKGEIKEDADKSVTFSIGEGVKPLKLIPGLAFDAGYVSKAAAIIDGTEVTEKPIRTDAQIRQEALACIGNNIGNVPCYDLGRDRANLEAQTNNALRKGVLRQARTQ